MIWIFIRDVAVWHDPVLKTTQLSAHAQNHVSIEHCHKSFTTIFYHLLLLPVLIAVVLLYSACLCVCLCVCEYVFVCVLLLFFTDCRIHLFSSLAARVFNKLTRYSLLVTRPAVWPQYT